MTNKTLIYFIAIIFFAISMALISYFYEINKGMGNSSLEDVTIVQFDATLPSSPLDINKEKSVVRLNEVLAKKSSLSTKESITKKQKKEIEKKLAEIETQWQASDKELAFHLNQSGYREYNIETLKNLADNGDGYAAIAYLISEGSSFSENEALHYSHIAIRQNLKEGYLLAAESSSDLNKSIAYYMLASEKFNDISTEDVEFIMEYAGFYPKINRESIFKSLTKLKSQLN